jgi:Sec-independent protein secretion pathway component TatC
VIVGIAVFSAVVTPGGDLVSPTVLGLTLYILFEGTILFIRRTGR